MLTQLKKDGKKLLNEMEQVLHPDTCDEFEKLPKLMEKVLAKHQHLQQWTAPKDDTPVDAIDPFENPSKEANIIEEMVTQRDLLFRKNQIAVASASQSKRECQTDVRRLTSENAVLIAEMNTLRNERKSWQRSYKELEAKMMAMDAENNAKARISGKVPGNESMKSTASSPALGTSQAAPGKARSGSAGGAVGDTPYVRRKVVDQQEVYRRKQMQGQNQLPPVNQQGGGATQSDTRVKSTPQEKRFTQSLDQVQAGRRQMERQGFDVGNLTAHALTTGMSEPPEAEILEEPESFQVAETIQG